MIPCGLDKVRSLVSASFPSFALRMLLHVLCRGITSGDFVKGVMLPGGYLVESTIVKHWTERLQHYWVTTSGKLFTALYLVLRKLGRATEVYSFIRQGGVI